MSIRALLQSLMVAPPEPATESGGQAHCGPLSLNWVWLDRMTASGVGAENAASGRRQAARSEVVDERRRDDMIVDEQVGYFVKQYSVGV